MMAMPRDSDPPLAMAALRLRTRAAHERLEATVDLRSLTVSRAGYAETLSVFYGIYAVLEPALWQAVPWTLLGLDAEQRRKLPLLLEDLAALGIDYRSLPLCSEIPDVSSVERALGALYVLEGSTLGGKLIRRELQRGLGLESRFFSSYGASVGSMWRDFTCALERFADEHGGLDETIAAANDTFLLFEREVSRSRTASVK
jgi:heme oxygenase